MRDDKDLKRRGSQSRGRRGAERAELGSDTRADGGGRADGGPTGRAGLGGEGLAARRFFGPDGLATPWQEVTSDSREWERFCRQRWAHDKVVRSTHGVNCTGSCSWKIHVKDGIITWETQQTDYPSNGPEMPDYEPRGCPRGASFSWYVYNRLRIKHPYVRGELLRLWRSARCEHPDPVGHAVRVGLRALRGSRRRSWSPRPRTCTRSSLGRDPQAVDRREHVCATAINFADGSTGRVGFINSVSEPFCADSDRIRLTADGRLLPTCLFSQHESDLRGLLRDGADDNQLERIIRDAVSRKPQGHHVGEPDFVAPRRTMSAIGG